MRLSHRLHLVGAQGWLDFIPLVRHDTAVELCRFSTPLLPWNALISVICSSQRERLYFTTRFSLIQCVEGLMSYEDGDLPSAHQHAAHQHAKHGNAIASRHRKRQGLLVTIVPTPASAVTGGSGVRLVKSMPGVERHAELVYAFREGAFAFGPSSISISPVFFGSPSLPIPPSSNLPLCISLNLALLGIVYSGDWLAFIKEECVDFIALWICPSGYTANCTPSSKPPIPNIAPVTHLHQRPLQTVPPGRESCSAWGCHSSCQISFGLMPGKLMTLVELFGDHGDREKGLEMLIRSGGWGGENEEPSISAADEGLRQLFCDMSFLIFHPVISSFTLEGIATPTVSRILKWNLKRYPDGVFFLFGAGSLALMRSQPSDAIQHRQRAIESNAAASKAESKADGGDGKGKYRNLDHVSYWEIACVCFALWDVRKAEVWWEKLERGPSWSKPIYSYGLADAERRKRPKELMRKVPDLRQRIAGKSIPLEKFVAPPFLPGLELTYIFQSISHAPRAVIRDRMLPEANAAMSKLRAITPKGLGMGWTNDICLTRFLQGVCLRYLAYPDENSAELQEAKDAGVNGKERDEKAKEAETAFREVFQWGPGIQLDYHIVYHPHYELGRLFACQGRIADAREQFEFVLSGKHLEAEPNGKKGKYSLELPFSVERAPCQSLRCPRAFGQCDPPSPCPSTTLGFSPITQRRPTPASRVWTVIEYGQGQAGIPDGLVNFCTLRITAFDETLDSSFVSMVVARRPTPLRDLTRGFATAGYTPISTYPIPANRISVKFKPLACLRLPRLLPLHIATVYLVKRNSGA
ncbi:hypothetical protein NMY22_g2292 [Coprinellus aureogranulatus]|nr:hypothetical protein NMY22_g2292 [Coprinellus aureogranulatus]